jgi:hypothetical protein
MFKEISLYSHEHADKLKESYRNSKELNIPTKVLKFRKLTETDYNKIFAVVDSLSTATRFDFQYGSCLKVHHHLSQLLSAHGYESEVVVGGVKVNDKPFIICDFEYLTKQWNAGFENGTLNVHCWLLLENHTFLDVTLYNDLFEDGQCADIRGIDKNNVSGQRLEYFPMLVGKKFIEKTCLPSSFAQES